VPTPEEITRHHDPDPDEDPWVVRPPSDEAVSIIAYDSGWPDRYAALAAEIRVAVGDLTLDLEHVGSTSVPGLAAKDVIDIDLTVVDPRAEDAYLPSLEGLGYVLTVRETSWHEHRALRRAVPRANLHVFGPDCPEVIRHRMFRDWLTAHPDDLALYAQAKRAAVPGGGTVMDYNRRKEAVIREIYDRLFRAEGLLSDPATDRDGRASTR
jgi:GrpB-like predicted nucleotidyltransferase (UPF0157 family)